MTTTTQSPTGSINSTNTHAALPEALSDNARPSEAPSEYAKEFAEIKTEVVGEIYKKTEQTLENFKKIPYSLIIQTLTKQVPTKEQEKEYTPHIDSVRKNMILGVQTMVAGVINQEEINIMVDAAYTRAKQKPTTDNSSSPNFFDKIDELPNILAHLVKAALATVAIPIIILAVPIIISAIFLYILYKLIIMTPISIFQNLNLPKNKIQN